MNDWKKLMKEAENQGWRIVRTKSDHFKWFSPDGKTLAVSGSTTSDRRALKNHISTLRKGGFHD